MLKNIENRKNLNKNSEIKGRRKQDYRPTVIALIIAAVLAVIFYCSGGLGVYHGSAKNKETIENTVEKLAALEAKTPTDFTGFRPVKNVKVNIPELQEELLSHLGEYDYNSENFRRWFENAAIVGDSVAEAIKGFEWVNDSSVQSEIGISLYSSEDVIASTEAIQPAVIFLTFSANDIKSYTEYVNTFISDYTDVITRLQNSVPGAEIYVQGILPCAPEFAEEYWYYEYLDEYNERIEQMCEEIGAHYYNVNFILEQNPDIFSEDGIHPTWPFYPLWMTYMAKIAGLADE